jgi:CheY-like chemotaxis protein
LCGRSTGVASTGSVSAEGRSVVKILVADDNSNIQKMVGLALKDQGIDVIAVGNGEAAVRKISDLRPDLVLADVFMPVRNGYEVCQYVKMDASLAHIPVILLVGAFDPLDEQEAQRVGADGVLKKPFVPPDPLISMVKSALQRAGVAQGAAGAVKVPEPEVLKGTDLLTSSLAPVPTLSSVPMHTASPEPVIAALDQESFVDEVPPRPEPVQIDSGAQPVAFGSLLETPADVDMKDDELGFLPQAHPDLAPERDWRDTDAEELDEEAEEEKPAAPWRREEAESYADSETSGGAKDWRSGSFEQILARKAHEEPWEPVEERPEVVETAPAASKHVVESPAVPASTPEPAAVTGAITSTPFATDAWAAVSPSASQEKISTKTPTAVEEVNPVKEREQPSLEAVVASTPEASQVEPQTKTKESWFSVPSNPWNTELEKANRLASAWDSGAPVAAPPASGNGTEKATEAVNETAQKMIEEAALPAETVEAIREEAAQVAEDATLPEQQTYDGAGFYATEEVLETPAPATTPASTPSMDDLVAKVLAKLNPEVLQAVTREILKPVVEAMVQEEMKSKKS